MKYNFQKQHILFIILLIVGIVFLIQGIPKAFFTDTVVEDESPLFTEPLRGELNQSMEFPDGSKNSFNISYNFTTKFAYAPGNPIFFQFDVTVFGDELDTFAILVDETSTEISGLFFGDPNNVLSKLIALDMAQLLQKDTNDSRKFHAEGNFTYYNIGDFGIYPMLIKNGMPVVGYETKKLFSIESSQVKIQAETNLKLQQLVDESKRSNERIEGLTYILIALVPLGIFINVVIRQKV